MKALRITVVLAVCVMMLTSMSFARNNKSLILGSAHDLRVIVANNATTFTGLGGQFMGYSGTPSYYLCNFCHIAHKFAETMANNPNAPGALLWNHKTNASAVYTVYSSPSFDGAATVAAINPTDFNNPTTLCLGCHDGTIAVNSTFEPLATGTNQNNLGSGSGFGNPNFLGGPAGSAVTGPEITINPADMNKQHPLNFDYAAVAAVDLGIRPNALPGYVDSTREVPIPNGKMQCNTCHDPHNGISIMTRDFKSAGYTTTNGSWCLYCHL